MRKALVATFVVLLLCVSVGSVKAYTNSNNFFSIEEPSGWTTSESSSGTVVVTFYEPSTDNDSFALIEVDVSTITESITFEEISATLQDQYQTAFDSFNVISESGEAINGVDAYEITAAITVQGMNFRLKQDIMIKNSRIYIVSYAATMDRYQQFLPDFEDSLQTFTIHDPIPPYFWYIFVEAIVAVVSVIAVGLYIYKRRANTPIASY